VLEIIHFYDHFCLLSSESVCRYKKQDDEALIWFPLDIAQYPLAMSRLSLQGEAGGSCENSSPCGKTPDGADQFSMIREEDCEELVSCIPNGCFLDYSYCTANVDTYKEKGYGCFADVIAECGNRAPDDGSFPTRASFIELMLAAPLHDSRSTFTKSMQQPIMIQGEQCTVGQCGNGPDGKKQRFMIDPADCDDYNDCGDPKECVREYFFCAEEFEIVKTRLLTRSYECTNDFGDEDFICEDN
jgi:hypothetical protein